LWGQWRVVVVAVVIRCGMWSVRRWVDKVWRWRGVVSAEFDS
jgi:hypothetical protein